MIRHGRWIAVIFVLGLSTTPASAAPGWGEPEQVHAALPSTWGALSAIAGGGEVVEITGDSSGWWMATQAPGSAGRTIRLPSDFVPSDLVANRTGAIVVAGSTTGPDGVAAIRAYRRGRAGEPLEGPLELGTSPTSVRAPAAINAAGTAAIVWSDDVGPESRSTVALLNARTGAVQASPHGALPDGGAVTPVGITATDEVLARPPPGPSARRRCGFASRSAAWIAVGGCASPSPRARPGGCASGGE